MHRLQLIPATLCAVGMLLARLVIPNAKWPESLWLAGKTCPMWTSPGENQHAVIMRLSIPLLQRLLWSWAFQGCSAIFLLSPAPKKEGPLSLWPAGKDQRQDRYQKVGFGWNTYIQTHALEISHLGKNLACAWIHSALSVWTTQWETLEWNEGALLLPELWSNPDTGETARARLFCAYTIWHGAQVMQLSSSETWPALVVPLQSPQGNQARPCCSGGTWAVFFPCQEEALHY